jgi:type I restriction enzyme S subunit
MSWAKSELVSVCDVFADGDWIETKDQSENGIRLIQTGNVGFGKFKLRDSKARYISEETFKRLRCTEIKQGDILISRLPDPVGRACVIPELNVKSITAVDCTIIRTNKKIINTEYLNYFCQSYEYFEQVKKNITGATRQRISRNLLGKIKVPRPPLPIQQKIVNKLDAIFAEIDKATAAAGANAKNSYALYSSAVDSIFGKLTDKNVKLSSCSDIGYGYTSKSSSEFLGPQYLRITDIQDDSVDWLLVPKINEKSSDVGKFLLKDGDIVFARTGATTGKSYLIKEPPISVFASYLIRVDVNRDYVDPEYLRHFFRSDDYWTAINAGISGAAQGGFNASKLGELSFPLPDLTIQKKIIEKLDVIETHSTIVKKSQENKVKELKLLRQSILKQAFNGELIKAA